MYTHIYDSKTLKTTSLSNNSFTHLTNIYWVPTESAGTVDTAVNKAYKNGDQSACPQWSSQSSGSWRMGCK